MPDSTNLDLTVMVYAIKIWCPIKAGLVLIEIGSSNLAQKCKRKFKTFAFLFFRNNSMKWTEDHDLTLCGEVLLQEPFKYPKNSKERGEIWGQIALNLNSLASPIFKVSKRSVRDRLTLLQTKYKEKIREEERASGIDCEETQLDTAVEEILDKEKAADMERNKQAGSLTKKTPEWEGQCWRG